MKKIVTTILTSLLALSFTIPSTAPAYAATVTPTAPTQFENINENSSRVKYSGYSWKNAAANSNYTQGTAKANSYTGSATLTFTGTGVRLVTRTGSWFGKAKVSIDGGTPTVVDLYSPKTVWQKAVFEKRGLVNKTHTIKVEWANSKNVLSSGKGIEVDAFHVLDGNAPAAVSNVNIINTTNSANLTWSANTETDFKEYTVEKADAGTQNFVTITPPQFTGTAMNIGSLVEGKAYQYRVTAYDTSGNATPTVYDSTYAPATAKVFLPENCPTPTVRVSTDTQLRAALSTVKAGDVIKLADGRYSKFAYDGARITGDKPTETNPVWICGSPNTIVNAGSISTSGNGLSITNASYLNVAGLNLTGGHRGINVTYSDHVTLTGNTVKKVGLEAIHLMNQTVDSTVVKNTIEDTGLLIGEYGEAVYVGTSEPNWDKFNKGLPDTSDRNRILNNTFTRISGECIDVKSATSDGVIKGNVCDAGFIGARDPEALKHTTNWIALRGNSWLVDENTFVTTAGRQVNKNVLNGIQVFSNQSTYGGYGNVIRNNVAKSWTDTVQYSVMNANPAKGNIVSCNNAFWLTGRTAYQFGCQL